MPAQQASPRPCLEVRGQEHLQAPCQIAEVQCHRAAGHCCASAEACAAVLRVPAGEGAVLITQLLARCSPTLCRTGSRAVAGRCWSGATTPPTTPSSCAGVPTTCCACRPPPLQLQARPACFSGSGPVWHNPRPPGPETSQPCNCLLHVVVMVEAQHEGNVTIRRLQQTRCTARDLPLGPRAKTQGRQHADQRRVCRYQGDDIVLLHDEQPHESCLPTMVRQRATCKLWSLVRSAS